MTGRWARRGVALSVGQRLFVGLLPSLLAVALVAGLAYYGQYAHAAPAAVIAVAAVLALVSLALTGANARYLARRIGRLAEQGPRRAAETGGAGDELDRIEQVVDRLGSALTVAERERARTDARAGEQLHEQATLLAVTARDAIARLDDVRLPLHILLEARFGELNENQEELLRDARDAAEVIDGALRRFATVADADRGALAVQLEAVQVNDVVRAVLPIARAAAERRGARVTAELEPGLPRVRADRVRLAEALTLLLDQAAMAAGPATPVVVSTARDDRSVVVAVAPSDPSSEGEAMPALLANRLIAVQGGRVERSAVGVRVHVGQSALP